MTMLTADLHAELFSATITSFPSFTLQVPRVDMDMVERLLGRRRRTTLTARTRKQVQACLPEVLDCLDVRITWSVHAIEAMDEAAVVLEGGSRLHSRSLARGLEGADRVVVFALTAGSEIEELITDATTRGAAGEAYVIDAIASGAVEHAASSFQDEFAAAYDSGRYAAGLRFSPGYCDWSITEQHVLFTLLDSHSIGVQLSDTALMSPRKSVSALFGLRPGDAAEANSNQNPCSRCAQQDCIARRRSASTPTTRTQ